MNKLKYLCPCLFGLESVLSGEIKRLGGEDVQVSDGKVTFYGDFSLLARANLNLRTAERVLVVLGHFAVQSFEDLFQGVKALPLENFIGEKDRFPVKGWSLNSKLASVPDCQAIIKKAAVERLKEKYGISWFEESGSLFQIQFSILKNEATVMLDTTGAGLHKRGYRRDSNEAPIKETLAAGIIDLARVRPDSIFYDPFCGSGTFLIEAAAKALNIAPGINRRFAAEKWPLIPPEIWQEERTRCFDQVRRDASFIAYGSDIDPACVSLTEENARKAGVGSRIRLKRADIKEFSLQSEGGIVVCNPPYGERLLDVKQAEELYHVMGERFVKGRANYYIISPHENFERIFGRPATKRRKLYNGMIRCQLFLYF